MKQTAFAATLLASSAALAQQPTISTQQLMTNGDVTPVASTGLGAGGFIAVSALDKSGALRLYLYTGSAPSDHGKLEWYETIQPSGQHPMCVATLTVTDPEYAGGFTPQHWPFPSQAEFEYWTEYPTLILNWQTATPLLPNSTYSVDTICPPRTFNPIKHGVTDIELGTGIGAIQ